MGLKILLFLFIFIPVEWKTHNTPEFTIQYPDNWDLDTSGLAGTKFVLFSPQVPGANFRENVNLIMQDLKGTDLDLKKFTELSVSQIGQYITDSKILSTETVTASAIPKHRIIYTGKQGALNLKWKQYFWVVKETAFVLTFTSVHANYDQAIGTADKVLDSFNLR